MNRTAYLYARALIRANGYFALRWIRMSEASIMLQLKNQKADKLAEKLSDADVLRMAKDRGY
jgi:hypothetical protein